VTGSAGSTISASAGTVIGYARVSTSRQNLDRQIDAVTAMGATKVFADKMTGRTMDRPQWAKCQEYLRRGDALVVDNLDRLGRTALEVIATVKRLTDEGIVVRSQAQGELDPSTATGRLMIGMFSMLAEFEVDLKAERAAAAREAAAARGQHTGRPRKLATPDAVRARELKEKGMTATEIGKALGVSRATIYRYLIENASHEP
jgi:DNA invertase Pin-like site-specific DNA recombinase